MVEEDLAAIFSRGKIVPSLENHFRDVVKVTSFTPLHAGSEIVLDGGPGATVCRALKDRHYMSAIIQLSFLGFIHETTGLAESLVDSMQKRYDLGVSGATPAPDYDGILATLLACTSQTSQSPWEMLVSLVEYRFPKSARWFSLPKRPLKHLSPKLLLGAMDYLYLVQSLPEDRIMMIENQMGLVPIVMWAHCILGLTVWVQSSPDGDVTFGNSQNPQVVIRWSDDWELDRAGFGNIHLPNPAIHLLDGNMEVVLTIGTEDGKRVRLEGEDRLRLRGYGTTCLRRLFNTRSMLSDDDPLYAVMAQYAIAFAIVGSRVMWYEPFVYVDPQMADIPEQWRMKTELWRIMASSELLFQGLRIKKNEINQYVKRLQGVPKRLRALPTSLKTHLEGYSTVDARNLKDFCLGQVELLALWLLSFAQVIDLESCSDMQLIYDPSQMDPTPFTAWKGIGMIAIEPELWLTTIVQLMMGDTESMSLLGGLEPFLISHRGWSVFLNRIGDNDPGKASGQLISIKRGVPTSTRTNERKHHISDAPDILSIERWDLPRIIDQRDSYLPRCVSPVVKRREYYSSRGRGFLLSIRFDVDESGLDQNLVEREQFSIYTSYRQLHQGLCGVLKTSPCPHPKDSDKALRLDLGVVTVTGFRWTAGEGEVQNQHTCIHLVKGDARARWLVINGVIKKGKPKISDLSDRQVMLRCDDCCEGCAVQAARERHGNWLVIL